MFKLFTFEGASRILPDVDERLRTLQTAIHEFEGARERASDARAGTTQKLEVRQELAFLASAVHDAHAHLAELGVMVPDVGRGVVEFPFRLGGEVVHLLWEPGQDAITHYHRLTGDEAPRPVPEAPSGPAVLG